MPGQSAMDISYAAVHRLLHLQKEPLLHVQREDLSRGPNKLVNLVIAKAKAGKSG
jgi:hypothetical protein